MYGVWSVGFCLNILLYHKPYALFRIPYTIHLIPYTDLLLSLILPHYVKVKKPRQKVGPAPSTLLRGRLGLFFVGLGDMDPYQPGNQDRQIELAYDRLQERQ